MAAGKDFIGLVPPKDKRPASALISSTGGFKNFVRDQLTVTTWLCLGAIAQGLLFLVAGRLALLPPVLVVLYKVVLTYAQTVGFVRNPHMDGVIGKKFAAQIPDENGSFGNKPADSDVVVFLLGAQSNHPLGGFESKFKELGDYFGRMAKHLDANAEEYGFLGMTGWTSDQRETANGSLTVCYFRNIEGLHKFAHADLHREAWNWWNKGYSTFQHLSIWHETYHVPKGNWESIYVNSHASGINSTTYKYTDKESGKDMWASPIVDASKGLLRTSAGRMSRSKATEHHQLSLTADFWG